MTHESLFYPQQTARTIISSGYLRINNDKMLPSLRKHKVHCDTTMQLEKPVAIPPNRNHNPWMDFWKSESIFSSEHWAKNTELLIQATESIMHYHAKDIVLDIGCGTGGLEMYLCNRVGEIHGLDVSSQYISQDLERFKNYPRVHFHELREDYLDFSFLEGKKFDKIVCHSVVQYYRGLREMEILIHEVRKIVNPGALFLISDIPVEGSCFSLLYGF